MSDSLAHGRILYITDKYKVSQGYEPAFTKLVRAAGIPRQRIVCQHIYDLVPNPLQKKGNEGSWRFNPDLAHEIEQAFRVKISSIKPLLIVVSCPAVVGVLTGWDYRGSTLDKCRGGVYYYEGIPCVVVLPITAINQKIDERLLKDQDGEGVKYEPYRIKQGAWILARDWEKVGRIFNGKARPAQRFVYSICRTPDDCTTAVEYLRDCVAIAEDTETGCYPAQITCVGFAGLHKNGTIRTYVIPFTDKYEADGCFWASEDEHAHAYNCMAEINSFPILKIMQNGNYDCSYFLKYRVPPKHFLFDTMLMFYSMFSELPKSLDFISSILLDNYQYWKDDIKGDDNDSQGEDKREQTLEGYWRYNALDCYYTLYNAIYLMRFFQASSQLRFNYRDTFMRAMSALQISMRGVKADKNRLEEHRVELTALRDTNLERLRYCICDPDFNYNSPPQKLSLLYDVLGARERNKKGKYVDRNKPLAGDNKPSSGSIPLRAIKTEHPFFRYVVERLEATMEPAKQISNVCDMKIFTDRFRQTLHAAGTTSTRFSSSGSAFWDGTNAQNIRATYRDWLVADEDCVLIDVDYSQSDDVFVAYESNDPTKIAVVESGMDGHAIHGELFFKMPYDQIVAGKKAQDPLIVDPITGVRQVSKKIVHGTNFQMAGFTLYMQMGREAVVAAAIYMGHRDADSWEQERLIKVCEVLMSLYRKKYPRLTRKEWYKEIAMALAKDKQLTNAFGITRSFLGDPSEPGTQREATGFIGQSGTAGNMNRSMHEIDWGFIPDTFRDGPNPDRLERPLRMSLESHGFRFLLQTHDSFTAQLSLSHPRWKEAAHNLLKVMNRPVIINGHSVRVKTEASIGKRWGKKMLDWKGDSESLEHVVTLAMQAK